MCYHSRVKVTMLASTAPVDNNASINFTISARLMLLLDAVVAFYDNHSLHSITYSGLETSFSELSIANYIQAIRMEKIILIV